MNIDFRDYIGDYAASEYFAFLPTHLKSHAESLLQHIFDVVEKSGEELTDDLLERVLLENVAPLDLPEPVRRDAPQLVEAFFEYLDSAGKAPGAARWAQAMPAVAERYTARFRGDGSVKGETVRHSLAKVGRNDPCPCGSGKKFKKCCIDLLS